MLTGINNILQIILNYTLVYRFDEIVLNIDLAPTFLDIAGVETPNHMDGRSIMKIIEHSAKHGRKRKLKWPDTFLIER